MLSKCESRKYSFFTSFLTEKKEKMLPTKTIIWYIMYLHYYTTFDSPPFEANIIQHENDICTLFQISTTITAMTYFRNSHPDGWKSSTLS